MQYETAQYLECNISQRICRCESLVCPEAEEIGIRYVLPHGKQLEQTSTAVTKTGKAMKRNNATLIYCRDLRSALLQS